MYYISPNQLDISDINSGAKWFKQELEQLIIKCSFSFYKTVYSWFSHIEKLELIDNLNVTDPVKFVYIMLNVKYDNINSIMDDINQIGLNYNFESVDEKIKENLIEYYSNPIRISNAKNIIIPYLVSIHDILMSRGFDWDYPYLGVELIGSGLIDESNEFIDEKGIKIIRRRSELLAIKLHNLRVKARENFTKEINESI